MLVIAAISASAHWAAIARPRHSVLDNTLVREQLRADLRLSDSSRWELRTNGRWATSVLRHLCCAMQLRCVPIEDVAAKRTNRQDLIIATCIGGALRFSLTGGSDPESLKRPRNMRFCPVLSTVYDLRNLDVGPQENTVLITDSPTSGGRVERQVWQLTVSIALKTIWRGGLLVHGVLVEHEGRGFILTGPSGAGKTTARERLPEGWQGLSDDATLVLRCRDGFWGHPWPGTRELLGLQTEGCDVQRGVPLWGVFFLQQSQNDQLSRAPQSQAACMLIEASEQLLPFRPDVHTRNELRKLRLSVLDNVCDLVRSVPVHILQLTLDGHFWEEIERVLGAQ